MPPGGEGKFISRSPGREVLHQVGAWAAVARFSSGQRDRAGRWLVREVVVEIQRVRAGFVV